MAEDAHAKIAQIREYQSPMIDQASQSRVDKHVLAVQNFTMSGDVEHIEEIAQSSGAVISQDQGDIVLEIPQGAPQAEMGNALTTIMKRIIESHGSTTTTEHRAGENVTKIACTDGQVLEIITDPDDPENTTYALYVDTGAYVDTSAPVANPENSMAALAFAEEANERPTVHFYTTKDEHSGMLVNEVTFLDVNPPDVAEPADPPVPPTTPRSS